MLGLVRRISILLGLLASPAWLPVGCAHSVLVDVDEQEDFSSYRTWDWMPQISRKVIAPYGQRFATIGRAGGRLIEAPMLRVAIGVEAATSRPLPTSTSRYFQVVKRQTEVRRSRPSRPNLLSTISISSRVRRLARGLLARETGDLRHGYRLAIAVSRTGLRAHDLNGPSGRGPQLRRRRYRASASTHASHALLERFPPYDLALASRAEQ